MDIFAWTGWFQGFVFVVPVEGLWMLLLALLVSASGFYRTVYFVSIGYAFSIVAMVFAGLFLSHANLSGLKVLHCILLGLYGLRLGSFLLYREMQPSYSRELKETEVRSGDTKILYKFLIWIGVSLLYVMMFSPCLFHLTSSQKSVSWATQLPLVFGLAIALFGLVLEALADRQKSQFKKEQPGAFCDRGLYRWVRCPNYLGEMIFWAGNWIVGLPFYTTPARWSISLMGLVCIVLIMMGSTKRLEEKQGERYGELERYQQYIKSVPVLFPFVPIYTLKHIRVYIE